MKLNKKGLERLILEEYRSLMREAGQVGTAGAIAAAASATPLVQKGALENTWNMHWQGNTLAADNVEKAFSSAPMNVFIQLLQAILVKYADANPELAPNLKAAMGTTIGGVNSYLDDVAGRGQSAESGEGTEDLPGSLSGAGGLGEEEEGMGSEPLPTQPPHYAGGHGGGPVDEETIAGMGSEPLPTSDEEDRFMERLLGTGGA